MTEGEPQDDGRTVVPPSEPSRSPAWIALGVGVLAVLLAVVLQPSIVQGGSGSVQAVAIAVVLALVFLGFVVLAFRFVHQPVVLAAVVGLPLIALAGVLSVTALVDDEADDTEAEQLATTLDDAEAGVEDDPGSAVEPEVPGAAAGPTTTTAPAGPVRLSTGTFEGLDDHAATGTASLVEQPDGSQVVLFEDFEVERGPDYIVYLVPGEAFDASAGVEVQALQGNVGDQQYEVPAELVGTQPLTVLIWCRAFDVNIAGAVLS